jgi:hypothetical protein
MEYEDEGLNTPGKMTGNAILGLCGVEELWNDSL